MRKQFDLIILCGGLGSRLRSVSKHKPKILVKINRKKNFFDLFIKNILKPEIKKIILSSGYKKNYIRNYINSHYKKNKKIFFSEEKTQLGTGGAIKLALKNYNITNPFFVVNGDSFFKIDFSKIIKIFNKEKKSVILLTRSSNTKRFDIFKVKNNKIFIQKKNTKVNNLINSGLYFFCKNAFKIRSKSFSIERDIIPELIEKKQLNFYVNEYKTFYDIGIPEDLNKFKKYIKNYYE